MRCCVSGALEYDRGFLEGESEKGGGVCCSWIGCEEVREGRGVWSGTGVRSEVWCARYVHGVSVRIVEGRDIAFRRFSRNVTMLNSYLVSRVHFSHENDMFLVSPTFGASYF